MGVYLNPGNSNFRRACHSEIYVDKTKLIELTNKVLDTEQRFICISRPRRFGKSMAANMLAAYYGKECDSSELFEPYKIAEYKDYKRHLNQYNVIMLNIQDFLSLKPEVDDMILFLQKRVIAELKRKYPDMIAEEECFLSLALEDLYSQTGEPFILIIDEWDCILREQKYNADDQKKYLDFLRNLLKDKAYVALAYMTGILPIKKYGTHSALNMFDEYSMTSPKSFAEYIGFTETEVEELCKEYQADFETMKSWYDGYTFSKANHIYNPKSVVDALRLEEFASYWTQTETYDALKIYIDMNFDGLKDSIIKMLGGEKCEINTNNFQNDMTTFESKDDVLTLLIHLGYLAYDYENNMAFIPNEEVREEFLTAMRDGDWNEVIKSIKASEELLEALWNGDEKKVAESVDTVHMDTSSILTYNHENDLSCTLSLAFYKARDYYILKRELPAGKGFADIVLLPRTNKNKPAAILELKWDKDADTAIKQIKEKKYVKALENYIGEIILCGINYDKESKTHSCKIERIQK